MNNYRNHIGYLYILKWIIFKAAEMAGFRLLDKNDWYDNKSDIPKINIIFI